MPKYYLFGTWNSLEDAEQCWPKQLTVVFMMYQKFYVVHAWQYSYMFADKDNPVVHLLLFKSSSNQNYCLNSTESPWQIHQGCWDWSRRPKKPNFLGHVNCIWVQGLLVQLQQVPHWLGLIVSYTAWATFKRTMIENKTKPYSRSKVEKCLIQFIFCTLPKQPTPLCFTIYTTRLNGPYDDILTSKKDTSTVSKLKRWFQIRQMSLVRSPMSNCHF